jgi:hypothetical protein
LFRAGVPRDGISSSRTDFGCGTKGSGLLSLTPPPSFPPPPALPPPPPVLPIPPLYLLPLPLHPHLRKAAINMLTIINPPMLPPTIAPIGTFVRGSDVDGGGDCVGEGEGAGASWHTFETEASHSPCAPHGLPKILHPFAFQYEPDHD